MKFENINLSMNNHVGVITLNRPESMNAINSTMLIEINSALDCIESDSEIRVIVLTGGEKVFSAGFDIKEISTVTTPVKASQFLKNIHKCYSRMDSLTIPVIAAASGLTFGGGFELALTCDYMIASDTARFALPEINLGLMPGAGGTQRLPRMIGMGRACEMLFTGQPIHSDKALEMGLINRVTEQGNLIDTAMKMAGLISAQPGFALNLIKKAVRTGMNMDLASALDYETRCFALLFSTEDQKEGVDAFINKRPPVYKGI